MDQDKHIIQAVTGLLKGIFAQIPFIGTPIVEAWNSYWNSRLQDIISNMNVKINELGKEKIDLPYAESDEFIDLLHKCLKTRVQTRSKEKAKFILGMLIESLQINRDARFPVDLKENFLFLVDQLTDNEMIFLYDFSINKYPQKSRNDFYRMGDSYGIAVDGIIAKGILIEYPNQHVGTSMLGREFIDYLKKVVSE